MDSVEGFDWLLIFRRSFAIHLRATRTEFAPENISIIAGINELKSSFSVLLFHYLSVHHNSQQAVDIHDRFTPLLMYPPQVNFPSVNRSWLGISSGGFGHDETSNSELFKRIM